MTRGGIGVRIGLLAAVLAVAGCGSDGQVVYRSNPDWFLPGQRAPAPILDRVTAVLGEAGFVVTRADRVVSARRDRRTGNPLATGALCTVEARVRDARDGLTLGTSVKCRYVPPVAKHPWTAVPDLINEMQELETKLHQVVQAPQGA